MGITNQSAKSRTQYDTDECAKGMIRTRELSFRLAEANYTENMRDIFSTSRNTNVHPMQYKIIHRPQQQMTTFTHSGSVHQYKTFEMKKTKNKKTTTLSWLLGRNIRLSPTVCLLGNLGILKTSSKQIITALLVALTIAKKTILLKWRSGKRIFISQWVRPSRAVQVSMEQQSSHIHTHTHTKISLKNSTKHTPQSSVLFYCRWMNTTTQHK